MKASSVRGTPFNKVSDPGFRTGGGNASTTVAKGMQGSGINTSPGDGTPANYAHGNPGDFKRTVSQGKYGKQIDLESGEDLNNAASNGPGVVLGDTARSANGHKPEPAPPLDSPVPATAPIFDAKFMDIENAQHMGSGNETGAREDILSIGGVMSRGMVGTSHASNKNEEELRADDTLPATAPAGRAAIR